MLRTDAGRNDIGERRACLFQGGLNLAQDVDRLRVGIAWVLRGAGLVSGGRARNEHHVADAPGPKPGPTAKRNVTCAPEIALTTRQSQHLHMSRAVVHRALVHARPRQPPDRGEVSGGDHPFGQACVQFWRVAIRQRWMASTVSRTSGAASFTGFIRRKIRLGLAGRSVRAVCFVMA